MNNKNNDWINRILKFYAHLVCDYFEIPVSSIKIKSRKREYAVPRQVFWYLVKKYNGKSITLKDIGSYSGGRDHSTIIHGINTVDYLSEYELKPVLEDLIKEIAEYKGLGYIMAA